PPIQMVSVSGTYTLSQYEAQDSGVKALKILANKNTGTYYYVEFRSAVGFDSYNTSQFGYPAEVVPAVFVHQGVPTDPTSSELLNMAPANTSWSSPGLAAGQIFTDSGANITITAVSIGSTAVVQVALGSGTASCTHANPAVSMVGPSSSVAPGATASFSVTVTNNDNSACGTSTFNLGDSVPSGWSASYGSSAINIAPGSSGTVTLSVTNPAGTADGTYTVGSNALNSSATA